MDFNMDVWRQIMCVRADHAGHGIDFSKARFPTVEAMLATRCSKARVLMTITTGRTGTTTLCDLLNLSPSIMARHEPHPYLAWVGKLQLSSPMDDLHLCRLLYFARVNQVQRADFRGQMYAEIGFLTWPLTSAFLACFEGLQIIHLVRRPLDFVASSLAAHWFNPRKSAINHFWPTHSGYDWQQAIDFWLSCHSAGLAWERELGPGRVLRVHSESLWDGPEKTWEILDWLKAKKCEADLESVCAELDKKTNEGRFDKPHENVSWRRYLDDRIGEVADEEIREGLHGLARPYEECPLSGF